MISFEAALQIVLSRSGKVGTEKIIIEKSCGRYLAEDVTVCCDLPPFDKSAVDGYACRREDVAGMGEGASLALIEVIPAGHVASKKVVNGTCSKIMTGAPVPEGADMVLMVEQCEEASCAATVRLKNTAEPVSKLISKTNISYRGEDMSAGGVLLRKGLRIRPQDVAVIATCGCSEVLVYRKLTVGVISTGSELLEPGSLIAERDGGKLCSASALSSGEDKEQCPTSLEQSEEGAALPFGKIFNSNSWQLLSLTEELGGESRYYGIAPDSPEATEDLMRRAVEENELVLLSGGVSEGDFDFVPVIMKKLGMEILFSRVAVQPGKPTTFAVKKDGGCKYIFGLPGNPVSAFVQTLLLVQPLMVSMQGGTYNENVFQMPLAVGYKRKNGERLAHVPVRILPDGSCSPLEYHGSAHISALSGADALMRVPISVTHIQAGEKVSLILLPR